MWSPGTGFSCCLTRPSRRRHTSCGWRRRRWCWRRHISDAPARRRRPDPELPALTEEERARAALLLGRTWMIWFWIIAGLLVVAALIALLKPLAAGNPGEARIEGESVVALFRRQLTNLDDEIAQGRLAADEAAAMRAEITRRMLAAADQEAQNLRPAVLGSAATSWRIGAAVGIAALLPAAALAIYVGGRRAGGDRTGREALRRPATARPGRTRRRSRTAQGAAAAGARACRRLGPAGSHLRLSRALRRSARGLQAGEALAPNEPRLHAELGEISCWRRAAMSRRRPRTEFAKAGDDPRARFYRAEAALQRGDREAAKS